MNNLIQPLGDRVQATLSLKTFVGGVPMQAIANILVPVDFSQTAFVALAMASQIARAFGAKITLYHVIEMPPIFKGEAERRLPPVKDFESALKERAHQNMEHLLASCPKGDCAIVAEIGEGNVSVEIIEAAVHHKVDLIVMGTRGDSALKQMLIGSVAEKVVRKAPFPVLTVRPLDLEVEMP